MTTPTDGTSMAFLFGAVTGSLLTLGMVTAWAMLAAAGDADRVMEREQADVDLTREARSYELCEYNVVTRIGLN